MLRLVVFSIMGTLVGAAELRISASQAWAPPFGEFQNEQIVGGMVFDIGQALAARMGLTARWVVLPRKRLDAAAAAGEIDVRCYAIPAWVARPELYQFSDTLLTIDNIVIGRSGMPAIAQIDAIADKPVGTVLGFVYQALEPLAQQGRFRRDDAPSQSHVYKKLELGRSDYALGDSLSLAYHRRQQANSTIAPWRFVFEAIPFQCAILRSSRVPPDDVLTALREIKADKTVDKILARYR